MRTAKILVTYYPKRARKPRFRTIQRSAETTEEAIKLMYDEIKKLEEENKTVIPKSAFHVFDSRKVGDLIITPIIPESSNCNCVVYSYSEKKPLNECY